MTQRTYLKLTISAALLVIQACSYNTQTRNMSPYFDGILKFNETPIENARVLLSLDSKDTLCLKSSHSTKTDSNGNFSLKPAKEEHSYKPFLNYELDEWVVCAIYNNERYTLYSNNRYGSGNVSESLYLDCDLALKPINAPCDTAH